MKFDLVENAGLNPTVVANLKSIPIDSFSYNHYKLRHPGAIYNLMSSKLIDSISVLCEELKERKIENIKGSFRLVLYDFFQFYESCYEVMLCFRKIHKPPTENEPLHSWLKRNGYKIGEFFFSSGKSQLAGLRNCYNEIKHSSNDIQFIFFKNLNEITPGYFLDMPKSAYRTPIEPVSLNRELKRIYFLIYFLSEKLSEALLLHLKTIHGYNLVPSTGHIKDDVFKKLHQSMASLTNFYLLNEIGSAVYQFQILNSSMLFTEKIITESLIDDYYANGMNLEMRLTNDGYNNSVLVPSCGLEQTGSAFYHRLSNGMLRQLHVISC